MDYNVALERQRYRFPDVQRGGVTLNRATARPVPAPVGPPEFAGVRRSHMASIAPTTLAPDGPVVELDRPTTGIYVGSRRGTYLDLYQGVAQRLFDDTRILPLIEPLIASGLLARREINTDDYLGMAPPGVALPQDLAALLTATAQAAFPRDDGYRAFFSSSGTEAVEAALKAASRAAYAGFLRTHGEDAWAQVCTELGVSRDTRWPAGVPATWSDYPLFVVALDGGFHGRTLGSLALARSRPVHRVGFPAWRWARHVSPHDRVEVDDLVDWRPLPDVLVTPGALAGVVASGRIPAALLAAAIFEPFQGEGGYRSPAKEVLQALRETCTRAEALLIADEVQTFARGGAVFLSDLRGVTPDIICLAKAAIVGVTLLPGEVADGLDRGWHSNTFGSGRLFDVNYAHAVLTTFLEGREPAFAGLSYAENETVKGVYLQERLDHLQAQTGGFVSEMDGAGCMLGFTVPDRPAFIAEAWRQGAKLLGAGMADRSGRIRIILPADVLAREVDDVLTVLERTAASLRGAR